MHALALLLAFGSADTWHGDFHPVSSVPCLAHTSGISGAGYRVRWMRWLGGLSVWSGDMGNSFVQGHG
jgi:hypothetical protein